MAWDWWNSVAWSWEAQGLLRFCGPILGYFFFFFFLCRVELGHQSLKGLEVAVTLWVGDTGVGGGGGRSWPLRPGRVCTRSIMQTNGF